MSKRKPTPCGVCGKLRKSSRNICRTCSNLEKYKNPLEHPKWKGGKEVRNGYVWIWCPEHPLAHRNKIAEHRLVMEKHIGRYLEIDEIVHHIDGNKQNNNISNLQLMTASEHVKLHNKIYWSNRK